MRAIVRISISGDANGTLRNKLAGVANRYKFKTDPGGAMTGTWQTHNISEADYANFIAEYWKEIANHSGPGKIDHIWTVTDQWAYPPETDAMIESRLNELGLAKKQAGTNE